MSSNTLSVVVATINITIKCKKKKLNVQNNTLKAVKHLVTFIIAVLTCCYSTQILDLFQHFIFILTKKKKSYANIHSF